MAFPVLNLLSYGSFVDSSGIFQKLLLLRQAVLLGQNQTASDQFPPTFPTLEKCSGILALPLGECCCLSKQPSSSLLYLSSYTFQALFLIPVFVIPRFCGMSPVKFMWSLKAPSLTWLTVRWMYCLLSPVGDGHKQQHINNSLQRNRLPTHQLQARCTFETYGTIAQFLAFGTINKTQSENILFQELATLSLHYYPFPPFCLWGKS